MSPRGLLVTGLGALILLGVWALWLVNVPLWGAVSAGAVAAIAGWLIWRAGRRRRDRQKTEA